MKKKRNLTLLVLLLVVVFLGVGYATLTAQNLKIEGTLIANASEDNFDVKFTRVTAVKDPTKDVEEVCNITDMQNCKSVTSAQENVSATITGDLNATFTTTIDTKGKSSYVVYEIENASADLNASVTITTTTTPSTLKYFSLDKLSYGASGTATGSLTQYNNTAFIIEAGKKMLVKVPVTLQQNYAGTADSNSTTESFTITLKATPVEPTE